MDERAGQQFVMWRRQRRYSALFGVCSFSMVLERSVVLMRRWCMNMLCNLLFFNLSFRGSLSSFLVLGR